RGDPPRRRQRPAERRGTTSGQPGGRLRPPDRGGHEMSAAGAQLGSATEGPGRPALIERVHLRRGVYHDPVALMRASEAARALPGVSHVALGMGYSPLNLVVIGL